MSGDKKKFQSLNSKLVLALCLSAISISIFLLWIGLGFDWWDISSYGFNENGGQNQGGVNKAEILRSLIWSLGLLFGSIFALVGLANSLHRTQQKDEDIAQKNKDIAQKDREIQIAIRTADSNIFARSVEHLAHKSEAIRLGGLYAIENLARNAKARPMDEENIAWLRSLLETIAAFIRIRAIIPDNYDPSAEDHEDTLENAKTDEDVTAAMRIIARTFDGPSRKKIDNPDIDLQNCYLPRLNMPNNADLSNIIFNESVLYKAKLSKTNLSSAKLWEANLSGAALWYTNLSGAKLWDANLSSAILQQANLRGTKLSNANLSDAILWYANLSDVELESANLSDAELLGANLSDAELSQANLENADISNIIFHNDQGPVKGLTTTQVNSAKASKQLWNANMLPNYLREEAEDNWPSPQLYN